ncbi:MAG: hypothetical protein GXO50_09170 [Chlorobi bacterium]|nr:hypothetical protein [Chlorobiota bacterium]
MLKIIVNTFFIRILNAFFALFVVILNSKIIGSEGLGTVSLIILAVSVFILMTGFVSGALIYFVPRENTFKLAFISYSWSAFISSVFYVFLIFVPLVPKEFINDVIILAFLQSAYNINEKILAGKERIKTANYILLLKVTVLPASLLFFYFILKIQSVESYVYSLYLSYLTGVSLSFLKISGYLKNPEFNNLINIFVKTVKLSGYNTIGAVLQKLNFRLGYYFIEYFWGINVLGIFSAGVQISESVLIISRSIAFVQYSKISNLSDKIQAANITIMLFKFVISVSAAAMLLLSLIPSSFFSFLLGKDFSVIKPVIYYFSPGIIFASGSLILIHFFSGTGNQKINMYSSFAAFTITVFAGYFFIKNTGITGASLTLSLSFFVLLIFELFFFKKQTNKKISDFLIRKKDIISGIIMLKEYLNK